MSIEVADQVVVLAARRQLFSPTSSDASHMPSHPPSCSTGVYMKSGAHLRAERSPLLRPAGLLAALLSALMAGTGCSATSPWWSTGDSSSPTRSAGLSTTGVGALTGAAVGGGLGALVGAGTGDAGQGFVLGSIAGTILGTGVGYNLEQKEQHAKLDDDVGEDRQYEIEEQRKEIKTLRDEATDRPARSGRGLGPAAASERDLVPAGRSRLATDYHDSELALSSKKAQLKARIRGGAAPAELAEDDAPIRRVLPAGRAKHEMAEIDLTERAAGSTAPLEMRKSTLASNMPKSTPKIARTQAGLERTADRPASLAPAKKSAGVPQGTELDAKLDENEEAIIENVASTKKPVIKEAPGLNSLAKDIVVKDTTKALKDTNVKDSTRTAAKKNEMSGVLSADSGCAGAEPDVKRAKAATSAGDKLYYLKRAAKICPSNAGYYVEIGKVYALIGRKTDARGMFQRATELDPTSTEAQDQLESIQ